MGRMSMFGAAVSILVFLGLVPTATAAGPTALLLPQATAFALLGASCGGIQEQAFVTGFDGASGYPTGDVYLQTRCGGSGRGGGYHTTTYSAWVAVTWDFSGAVRSSSKLASAPSGLDPAFSLTDAHGDHIYNLLNAVNVTQASCAVGNTTYCTYRAYLTVVVPAAPTGVTASPAGGQFQVGWTPDPTTASLITSSTVTASPVGSTAPVVSVTASGPATSVVLGPLQPLTTYQITVVNTDAGGASLPSAPVTISTSAASFVPAAPTGVSGRWTAPELPGDTLLVTWTTAVPGDSPTDQYQVTVRVNASDPGLPGPVTQTVSGSALSSGFVLDDTLPWTIQVRAHNTAGWGAWSAPVVRSGV